MFGEEDATPNQRVRMSANYEIERDTNGQTYREKLPSHEQIERFQRVEIEKNSYVK